MKRRKTQDGDVWIYEDFGAASTSMADYAASDRDYSLGQFGPGINKDSVRSLMSGLDRDGAYDEEESTLADYSINENITAAYLMGSMDVTNDLHVIAGVRHEMTDTELKGNALTTDDELIRTDTDNDYSHTLPALLTRWNINRSTQMRAAWTNAVVRPTFEQMSPNFTDDGEEAKMGNPELDALESANFDLGVSHYMGSTSVVSAALFYKDISNFIYESDIAGSAGYEDYDEVITFQNGDNADLKGLESPNFTDDGEEAKMGNPELDALESANFDLGVSHYMGSTSVVSAALFYKDISNFIYESDIAGSAGYEDYDEVITFQNGDNADLKGLELAFSHQFSSLPAPFNGLLMSANATFTSSDATVSGFVDGELTERDIQLPNQSDVTGNFIVGYENDVYSVRLATNYKSEYLAEVNSLENDLSDVYQSSQTQMDLNAAYNATDNLKVTFEIANLTDEPYYSYQNKERYNAQYEDYGPTYRLGVRFTNF